MLGAVLIEFTDALDERGEKHKEWFLGLYPLILMPFSEI